MRSLEHRQRGTGPGPLSMCPDPQLGPDGRPPIQPPKLDAESAEVHSHSARHPDPCRLDLGRVDSGHEEASFHLGRGARGRRGHRSTKTTDKTPRPGPTSPPAAPSTPTSAGHVETCGVHFPRPMSDADAFEQAGRLDDLGELHARQPGQTPRPIHSGSCTVPGFACSHSASGRIVTT